jgi:hypothetical protein
MKAVGCSVVPVVREQRAAAEALTAALPWQRAGQGLLRRGAGGRAGRGALAGNGAGGGGWQASLGRWLLMAAEEGLLRREEQLFYLVR